MANHFFQHRHILLGHFHTAAEFLTSQGALVLSGIGGGDGVSRLVGALLARSEAADAATLGRMPHHAAAADMDAVSTGDARVGGVYGRLDDDRRVHRAAAAQLAHARVAFQRCVVELQRALPPVPPRTRSNAADTESVEQRRWRELLAVCGGSSEAFARNAGSLMELLCAHLVYGDQVRVTFASVIRCVALVQPSLASF